MFQLIANQTFAKWNCRQATLPTATTSIIDLLSSSDSSSEGCTSLGSLWNEDNGAECSSDSSNDGTPGSSKTVQPDGNQKPLPHLIGTDVEFSSGTPSSSSNTTITPAVCLTVSPAIPSSSCTPVLFASPNKKAPAESSAFAPIKQKQRNLTNEEREAIVHHLLLYMKPDGKLERDCTITVGMKFSVCARTVKRIWDQFMSSTDENGFGGKQSGQQNF